MRLIDSWNAERLRNSIDIAVRDNVFINRHLTSAQARAAYDIRCQRRQAAQQRSSRQPPVSSSSTVLPLESSSSSSSSSSTRQHCVSNSLLLCWYSNRRRIRLRHRLFGTANWKYRSLYIGHHSCCHDGALTPW